VGHGGKGTEGDGLFGFGVFGGETTFVIGEFGDF